MGGQAWSAVAPGGTAARVVDFGTGSDGAFLNGPTQTGITVAGATITVNTSVKSDFQFTNFTLGAGFTLIITGSNSLTIRSLNNISIAGIISGNGTDGSSGSVGGTPGGGNGTGSGGNGGNGSPDNPTAATAGSSVGPAASRSGGGIGANQNTGGDGEGGGGGCLGRDASAVPDADPGKSGFVDLANAGACTSSRAVVANAFETSFLGGGGGGGGGSFLDIVPPAYKGGAGGGGAAALRLIALGSVNVAGTIYLNGGNGGAAPGNGAVTGGGGGGGSGGAVWIQSYGTVSGAGTLSLAGGTGGDSTTVSGAATGGNGSVGIYRADTAGGTQSITTVTAGTTQAVSTLLPASTGTYEVVSIAVENGPGVITLGTPTETAGCGVTGTMTVYYEGSNDGTTFSSPVLAAQINELASYRYIRFRAQFTGADPPCLTALSIPYTLVDASEIALSGGLACSSLRSGGGGPGGGRGPSADFWLLLGSILMVGLLPYFRSKPSRTKIY